MPTTVPSSALVPHFQSNNIGFLFAGCLSEVQSLVPVDGILIACVGEVVALCVLTHGKVIHF